MTIPRYTVPEVTDVTVRVLPDIEPTNVAELLLAKLPAGDVNSGTLLPVTVSSNVRSLI